MWHVACVMWAGREETLKLEGPMSKLGNIWVIFQGWLQYVNLTCLAVAFGVVIGSGFWVVPGIYGPISPLSVTAAGLRLQCLHSSISLF